MGWPLGAVEGRCFGQAATGSVGVAAAGLFIVVAIVGTCCNRMRIPRQDVIACLLHMCNVYYVSPLRHLRLQIIILLVEDRADDILLVLRAFERAAIPSPVQEVKSGDEALQYLQGSERFVDCRSLFCSTSNFRA